MPDHIESPLVSVVLCAYNSEETIAEAIQSIVDQSYKNIELILVNDGSNDSTLEIIKSFADSDIRIKVYDQENIGLTASLVKACSYAKGEFIARQDADDSSDLQRIEKQLEAINEYGCDLITSRAHTNKGNLYPHFALESLISEKALVMGNIFIHGTFFFRKSVLSKVQYDKSFRFAQDYKFVLDLLSNGMSIVHMKEDLYFLREHEDSISVKSKNSQQECANRAVKGYFKSLSFLYLIYVNYIPNILRKPYRLSFLIIFKIFSIVFFRRRVISK